jgi:hypothetical protein
MQITWIPYIYTYIHKYTYIYVYVYMYIHTSIYIWVRVIGVRGQGEAVKDQISHIGEVSMIRIMTMRMVTVGRR